MIIFRRNLRYGCTILIFGDAHSNYMTDLQYGTPAGGFSPNHNSRGHLDGGTTLTECRELARYEELL